jgi:lysozyme family protein
MADNFQQALAFTLSNEGGFYDGTNPRDPNVTMKGVTQKTFDEYLAAHGLPAVSVRYITNDELSSIYQGYWDGAGCVHCGPLTAITLFDHAVNAGTGPAKRLLQKTLAMSADGVIGPQTEAAIAEIPDRSLAASYCSARDNFYDGIAKAHPLLAANLASWHARVRKFREEFLQPQTIA